MPVSLRYPRKLLLEYLGLFDVPEPVLDLRELERLPLKRQVKIVSRTLQAAKLKLEGLDAYALELEAHFIGNSPKPERSWVYDPNFHRAVRYVVAREERLFHKLISQSPWPVERCAAELERVEPSHRPLRHLAHVERCAWIGEARQ